MKCICLLLLFGHLPLELKAVAVKDQTLGQRVPGQLAFLKRIAQAGWNGQLCGIRHAWLHLRKLPRGLVLCIGKNGQNTRQKKHKIQPGLAAHRLSRNTGISHLRGDVGRKGDAGILLQVQPSARNFLYSAILVFGPCWLITGCQPGNHVCNLLGRIRMCQLPRIFTHLPEGHAVFE